MELLAPYEVPAPSADGRSTSADQSPRLISIPDIPDDIIILMVSTATVRATDAYRPQAAQLLIAVSSTCKSLHTLLRPLCAPHRTHR